jgi:hypothetical protein
MSDIDTPDGIYCKLPQDSPISVRGVRNFPCIRHPGKRAPTIQICRSDKPFVPLAMRQHVTGPATFDPSLIAQGVPIDDSPSISDNIFAPVQGTPLPAGAVPAGTPPDAPPGSPPVSPLEAPFTPAAIPPPPPAGNSLNGQPIPALGTPPGPAPDPAAPGIGQPAEVPPPAADGGAPVVAPSAFDTAAPGARPKVAVAEYNPRTGQYMGSDGKLYTVTNLAVGVPLPKTWKDLMPH